MSHATRPDLPAPEQSGIIAGYRLDRCIGQGSAAAVYLAQDERQDERQDEDCAAGSRSR